MVFNATFNNIPAISSFIGGGNWSTLRKPPTCHKSLTTCITWCCIEYTSPWTEFELTTLVLPFWICIVSLCTLLKTVRRSLYEILIFFSTFVGRFLMDIYSTSQSSTIFYQLYYFAWCCYWEIYILFCLIVGNMTYRQRIIKS